MNFGISPKSYALLMNAIAQFPQIEEAIIFGSRAKGNYKLGSDIDVAIKGEDCAEITWKLSSLLNEELPIPYFFDILDYHTLTNENLKEHINRVGKVLYQKAQASNHQRKP